MTKQDQQPRQDLRTFLARLLAQVRKDTLSEKAITVLEKAELKTVKDALLHLPARYVDRRYTPALINAEPDRIITACVEVIKHHPPARRGQPYRITVGDDTEQMQLIYFNAAGKWLLNQFPNGEKKALSGKVQHYNGRLQMNHPDLVGAPSGFAKMARLHPVYRLPKGVNALKYAQGLQTLVETLPETDEWLDRSLLKDEGWPSWSEALKTIHGITSLPLEDFEPLINSAKTRLAYDELLTRQVRLQVIRVKRKHRLGRALEGDGRLQSKLRSALPYTLTKGQESVLAEIKNDMTASAPMMRLLQGDVGSGKTVVALLAAVQAIEAGTQAALMAPTEILARQHAKDLAKLCIPLGIKVTCLTGQDKGAGRRAILEGIASGTSQLVIGTHALFQDKVSFRDLGLLIIDEQHRFGVMQRKRLSDKAERPDTLVMTATPIPRTLTLALFGDMEVSRLTEKPPGREPIDTRILSRDRLEDIYSGLERKLASGTQGYWVCPLVNESQVMDLTAAEVRGRELQQRFGKDAIGVLHGQMKGEEKNAIMQAFIAGKHRLLVSTTVIEVGVNVQKATLMIIEHAERFGLAQLHQLRGRIGRGTEAGTCLLLYTPPLSASGVKRLSILRESNDGFLIAETDLSLRGAGDVLGTQQSGLPRYRIADLDIAKHRDLLEIAQKDAEVLLNRDAKLEDSVRGRALRSLL